MDPGALQLTRADAFPAVAETEVGLPGTVAGTTALDAAEAFVKASQRYARQRTLNIVDEPIRYNEYLDILCDRLGAPRPQREWSLRKALSHRCSNEAARKELDWAPCWGLHSGKRLVVGA